MDNTFYRVGYYIGDVYCDRNCLCKDASLRDRLIGKKYDLQAEMWHNLLDIFPSVW